MQRLFCLLMLSVKVVAVVSMSVVGVEGIGMLYELERRWLLIVFGEGIDIEGERATIGVPIFRKNSSGSVRSSSSRTCSSGPLCDMDR